LGPDVPVSPGTNTYTLPLSGLSQDQIAYIRTIGINIRDHAAEGNLTWTISEIRSAGTPLTSRLIANYNDGTSDFDGAICNFECGAIMGSDGGQNNSGLSVVGGALEWTDLGGGAGAALTWGNGTQNSGGSFNARPLDLSNYDFVKFRMKATGTDPTLGVQFYMQTGSGYSYQSINSSLTVDGQYHDLIFSLASITSRQFVNASGFNLFAHPNNLVVDVDSLIYFRLPSLAIEHAANDVVIKWPTNLINFTLQSSTNIAAPLWSNVSPAPVVEDGQNIVTNQVTGDNHFYRLIGP
jgi:hypothetical protein